MMYLRAALLTTIAILLFLCPELSNTKKSKREEEQSCGKNVMQQLDNYLKDLEILSGKRKFPETIGQLKDACKINKNVMRLMTRLTEKCMSGFKKNVMQVTLYSIKKAQKSLCRTNASPEMRQFVAAGKCVNSGMTLFRKCAGQTVNNLNKVRFLEDKMKIPFLCCQVPFTKNCLLREAKKIPSCKQEHVDTLQDRFNHISNNGMNIACGDYTEETDKCSKVPIPKKTFSVASNKSLVMSMFDLLDTLPLDENLEIPS